MEIEEYLISSDAALVGLALEGDGAAFGYLFDRYAGVLRELYLKRMGGKVHDTDDLVQEIFIKAFLNLTGYNADYAFGQWIYTIAKNTFIDFLRRQKETLSFDDNLRDYYISQPVSLTPDPEENVIRSQRRVMIEQQLASMPPRYRELIDLRFFKDLSYEQIAEHLDLPMGTVKTQIHRARTQLCNLIIQNDL